MDDMGLDRPTAALLLFGVLGCAWAIAFGLALLADWLERRFRGRP